MLPSSIYRDAAFPYMSPRSHKDSMNFCGLMLDLSISLDRIGLYIVFRMNLYSQRDYCAICVPLSDDVGFDFVHGFTNNSPANTLTGEQLLLCWKEIYGDERSKRISSQKEMSAHEVMIL